MVKDATFTSKDRREQEKLATRARIIDAAREMFNENGVEATTMRAIADRIGYTATAIYYHFTDKDSLLLELCYQDFGALGRALVNAGSIADPIERLRSIGIAYVEFGLSNPSQYRFMFMTGGRSIDPNELVKYHKNPEEDAYEFLKKTVQEGLDQKRFRPGLTDIGLISNVLWAAVHGVVSLWIVKKHDQWVEFGDPRELGRATVDTVLQGLVADRR